MVPTATNAGSGFSDRSDQYLLYLVKLTNAFQFVTNYIVNWFCLILSFFKPIVNGLLALLPVSKQLIIYITL